MRKFKTLLSTILLIVFITSCTLAQKREFTEKDYPIQSFTSVEADIVGNIIYTQSSNTSVRVEGDKDLVDKLLVTADNEVLKLYFEGKQKNIGKKKVTIYISSPVIEKINMEGVGNFKTEGDVQANSLVIDFEGVGNFEAKQLQCTNIKATYEGVGNLKLAGSTNFLELLSEGVGSVNTKELKAKKVVVKAGGVGSVKCYASEHIELDNNGVGSITYYGDPTVKSSNNSGIGKVRAGK